MTGDDWCPIETAPKDGTKILLGRFVEGDDYDGIMSVDRYRRPEDNAGWVGFGLFNMRWWPPTHWMPLPSRPRR